MIDKYFKPAFLILLLIIMGQGCWNHTISNDDLYRERIEEYQAAKIEDLKRIDSLENNLNTIKHEIHKIDSITNSYSNTQIDSFYTDFFR